MAIFAEATSNTEAAEHYNIEESMLNVGVPKKTYFQQKYSEEVIITTSLQILNLKLVQSSIDYETSVEKGGRVFGKDVVAQRASRKVQCSWADHQVIDSFNFIIV